MSCIWDCSLLSSERHHDCNFRFKTNGKMWDHHSTFSLWQINPTKLGGEDSPIPPPKPKIGF